MFGPLLDCGDARSPVRGKIPQYERENSPHQVGGVGNRYSLRTAEGVLSTKIVGEEDTSPPRERRGWPKESATKRWCGRRTLSVVSCTTPPPRRGANLMALLLVVGRVFVLGGRPPIKSPPRGKPPLGKNWGEKGGIACVSPPLFGA